MLTEDAIKQPHILCSEWKGLTIFFQSNGDIPFDIFSASFFLLSRYEEYLPHKKDSYGRFAHESSLAYRENFLHLPLVNLWMRELIVTLKQRFSSLTLPAQVFSFVPTYDIDIGFAYKGQPLLKKLHSKLKGEKLVINGADVFDIYDWLDRLHHDHRLKPVYFFLLSSRRTKYDKNISPAAAELKRLVKRIAGKYLLGLHPSWHSYHDVTELVTEKNTLELISGARVAHSRRHYILFSLPHTYRELVSAGITNDYSMGYGSINGFRASYTAPFFWYDLMKEENTGLTLHPFCFMDANSFFEQQFTAEQAAVELQHYHDIVRQVNGTLITVFHNHFLTAQLEWQPWRDMYAAFLERNFPSNDIATSPSLQERL
jgi:hypothetical protein